MRRTTTTAAALLALALATSGCAFEQGVQSQGPAIFGGMRLWKKKLSRSDAYLPDATKLIAFPPTFPFAVTVLALDLVVDVLLLPASIPNELRQGRIFIDAR